jgi:hypothetical protein
VRFTVLGSPQAEQELAALWLTSARRAEVTRAAHALEQRLLTRPDTAGESRPIGARICFESPLGILFRLNVRTEFFHVWQFRTSPHP